MPSYSPFKLEHDFGIFVLFILTNENIGKRKEVADKIRSKYPDRIPVSISPYCSRVIFYQFYEIDTYISLGNCRKSTKE